jgi:hypothetical protein
LADSGYDSGESAVPSDVSLASSAGVKNDGAKKATNATSAIVQRTNPNCLDMLSLSPKVRDLQSRISVERERIRTISALRPKGDDLIDVGGRHREVDKAVGIGEVDRIGASG